MPKCSVTLVKKSALLAKAAQGAKAAGDAFVLVDNQDNTLTVMGVDAAGAPVDISAVATISVTSSDTAVLTVGTPAGTTCPFSGVAPGTVSLGIDAVWNDGSIGPFHLDLPGSVTGGPATGITVTFGTPTSR